MRVDSWGWIVSIVTGLLSGGAVAISLILFEVSSSETYVPNIAWATPPGVAALTILVSLIREAKNRSILEAVTNQLNTLKTIAYQAGQIDLNSIIESGLQSLISQFQDGRANVMLIDTEVSPQVLRIRYHYGMNDAPDLHLLWERREASCGRAWASGKQEKADLSQPNEQELRENWLMKPVNIASTTTVGSIVSIPLRDIRNRDAIIGVLNCDSRQPLPTSGLDNPEFLANMGQHAEFISRLIKLTVGWK